MSLNNNCLGSTSGCVDGIRTIRTDPRSKDNFNSDIKADELTSLWIWDQ